MGAPIHGSTKTLGPWWAKNAERDDGLAPSRRLEETAKSGMEDALCKFLNHMVGNPI